MMTESLPSACTTELGQLPRRGTQQGVQSVSHGLQHVTKDSRLQELQNGCLQYAPNIGDQADH